MRLLTRFLGAFRGSGLAVLIAFVAPGGAQNAGPAYEVASVKVNRSGGGSSSKGSPGQIALRNQSLHRLIERAFNLQPFQLKGPTWTDTLHFDILAKYPPDTKDEDRALMLRTLLQDRFKLAVHEETMEVQGYAMLVAKGGVRVSSAAHVGQEDITLSSTGGLQILRATRVSFSTLADFLSRSLNQPVSDLTGIPDTYDFELQWTDGEITTDNNPSAAPSLFTALKETLGVRLSPRKVNAKRVVVDHIERTPIPSE
jgi:uncharacterized protein (TIGR03435 family)